MKKILVVDDSKTILTLIKTELKKYDDIEAYFAESFKETMRLLRENGGEFHAALLDLNLPDAPNGEVVKLANSHGIPAVVLSATVNKELKESILKRDIIDFVLKDDPSSIHFALKAIQRTLKNYDTTILVVDDSLVYRATITGTLKRLHINVLEAKDGLEALDLINKHPEISLVITDYEMPNMDGHELTFKIRETYKKDQLSIIAISSLEKQETITKFLRFGANDFIHKPFTDNEIITRINANLELLDLFSQIKDMANKDFLTGLYNRRYFFDAGKPIFSKNRRKKSPMAVAMIDIDKFKNINDTYGHDIGDIAIKEVKNILEETLRSSDLVSRFGGEEFCILLEDITEDDTIKVFEKIRLLFEENDIVTPKVNIKYTVSIGICYGIAKNLDEMIKISDEALYYSKEHGRNQVAIQKPSVQE
ncbi:MAG: diguanylate cyclase [Sulfurimonas sp.]|nr:diguanylate cyclase [Sulfurimonas sp.]MDQ7061096.1 diguanylate cyclase [Sulfurimonas sp.]